MLIYVILFVIFLVGMKFILPSLNKVIGAPTANLADQQMQRWQQLARELGLNFTEVKKNPDPKVWQGGGAILEGTYAGVLIKISYIHETKEWASGLKTGYEYFIDNKIILKSQRQNTYSIEPKNPKLISQGTGVASFDQHLSYVGDAGALSPSQLEAIAKYQWMHLKATPGQLVFIDDYSQHIADTKGAMANMSAVNPVLGTSAKSPDFNVAQVKTFLNLLVSYVA